MVKEFTYADKKGITVMAQIWTDDKTGRPVRLRKVYYLGDNRLKSDCYWEEDPETFERWLKEIEEQVSEILKVISLTKASLSKANSYKGDGLAETVRIMKFKKAKGQM